MSSMPASPGAWLRLRPGVRVSVRSPDQLQVGLHHDRRLALPASADVRRFLARLAHGVPAAPPAAADLALLRRLQAADLVCSPDEAAVRERARQAAVVAVDAPSGVAEQLWALLGRAGLGARPAKGRPDVSLVVTTGAEPRRELVDRLVQDDRPHLLVTAVAGTVRIGPCVVPGLTACLRCVDEHHTDRDPRHPLVVEQHLDPDPDDRVAPHDLQLGLSWAVRDLVALVEGDRPSTWSATVELTASGPRTRAWRRHPRCGCAWGDALAAG